MLKIAVILGSTRPGRNGEQVAKWVVEQASKRGDAQYELVDVKDFNLPLLDEAMPAGYGQYAHEHTKKWAQAIAQYDGYVFVTPEYNHAPGAALKNAMDYIYAEWNNKGAAFVSYGSAGGARAVEQLRQVAAELQLADVRSQVMFNLFTDFENASVLKAKPYHEDALKNTLDQLVAWSGALKTLRA